MTLSPSDLSFGPQRVETTSPPETVILSNAGNTPLNITSIAASSDFPFEHNCPSSLPAGVTCTITVSFAPADVGKSVGSLTVNDDAGDSPHAVILSGAGADFSLALPPGGQNFAAVKAGESASYSLLLETSGFTGNGSVTCSGAPANSTCRVSPESIALDGSTPVNLLVSVDTQAGSTASLLPSIGPMWPAEQPTLALALFMVLLGMLALLTKRARQYVAWKLGTVMLCAMMWSGCGGGPGLVRNGLATSPSATQPGTYTLTVTANVNGVSRRTTLTLQVNP